MIGLFSSHSWFSHNSVIAQSWGWLSIFFTESTQLSALTSTAGTTSTNNEMAVEAITCKDYRDDKLAVAIQVERYQICLKLLRIYTPARDIDDRIRYRADDVKTCLNSLKSILYFQDLVFKMAQVFDNTDASCSAKRSGLKTVRAKLGLLNASFYVTYGLKFKTIDKNRRYYHLVRSFNTKDASELFLY